MILCRFFMIESYKLHHTRVVVLPGYGCDVNDYNDIVEHCSKFNVHVDVVPIKRYDWILPIKSIFNKKFWTYDLTPEDSFDWYLNKAKTTLINSVEKNDGYSVVLCGHSAGGWLARALMNNGTLMNSENKTYSYVYALVTMGTPNTLLCEKNEDVTHGCLYYVNKNFPGSFLKKQGIKYISLGSYAEKATINENNIALRSYLTILGKKTPHYIYGDGIVPLESTHLEDAIQLTFQDVFHYKKKQKKWYGDTDVINTWLKYL